MTAQHWLSFAALAVLGSLAICLVFMAIPANNERLLIFIAGAVSGALTVGGGGKLADKITNSTGPDATVQPDAGAGK